MASPLGVVEVTESQTRFISITAKPAIWAALGVSLILGFLIAQSYPQRRARVPGG